MLSTHSLARIAAIGGVILLARLPVSFWSVLTIITLTHYFIALV